MYQSDFILKVDKIVGVVINITIIVISDDINNEDIHKVLSSCQVDQDGYLAPDKLPDAQLGNDGYLVPDKVTLQNTFENTDVDSSEQIASLYNGIRDQVSTFPVFHNFCLNCCILGGSRRKKS